MPKLERSQWYDLCRDMNWQFKYVTEAEAFPEVLSQSHGIPTAGWWGWDEPYKISYREYVHNQAEKDAGVYSVRSAIALAVDLLRKSVRRQALLNAVHVAL
jgi:toluene monooxygenase system protein A